MKMAARSTNHSMKPQIIISPPTPEEAAKKATRYWMDYLMAEKDLREDDAYLRLVIAINTAHGVRVAFYKPVQG